MSEGVTGDLRAWSMDPANGIIYGTIYGDSKGRFVDGTNVRTSYVTKFSEDGSLAYTRNSVYKLFPSASALEKKHVSKRTD